MAIHKTLTKDQLPELIKIASTATQHFNKDDKNFGNLIRVTARILTMYPRKPKSSFKHAGQSLIPSDVAKAEEFWMMVAQKSLYKDIGKRKIQTPVPQIEYAWFEDGEKGGLRRGKIKMKLYSF